MPWMKDTDMQLCETLAQLHAFIDKIIARGDGVKKPYCCLDLETTGLNTRLKKGLPIEKIVGIALAIDKNTGIYIPINHKEGKEYNLPEAGVLEEIKRLCQCSIIIVHNAKFDLQFLKNYGVVVENFEDFEDTLILARLYDAGSKEIGLKHLSEVHLDRKMIEFSEITHGSHRFDMVSPKLGYVYAASDSLCTFGLFDFFISHSIVLDQMKTYYLEKRLVPVVMQMEQNLFLIDKDYLQSEKIRVTDLINKIKKNIIETVGKEFNVGSTQQLGKVLFDDLKYEYPIKEKTASNLYKTDTATLEKIEDRYPLVKQIITFRKLEKSLGTYIENLLKNCDEDNCIKLGFNQNGTDTGRFSSPGGKGLDEDGYCGVNVQSLPSNYTDDAPDIRKAFRARPGKKIVAMDFSGEELRVTANMSREKIWVDEFLYGSADLHTTTGKAIFKKDEITKAERNIGKTCNFQILYGSGPRGIAEQAKISENEARRAVDGFLTGLPILAAWIKSERGRARKLKFVKTPFGRVRPLQMFYDSGDKGLEAHADRCAVNFLIQGSCADIMKVAMVRIASWIKSNNLQDEIKILITMHDELVFEMPEDKLHIYIPQLNNLMCMKDVLQDMLEWPVPLTLDAEYGDTWHVDHDFFKEHPELKELKEAIVFQQSTQVVEPKPLVQPIPENPLIKGTQAVSEESLTKEELPLVNMMEDAPLMTAVPTPPLDPINISGPLLEEIPEEIVFTIRDRSKVNLCRLNQIITFLTEMNEFDKFEGKTKLLKIKDKDDNILTVSNLKVRNDAFYALAFFNGI
jgi:DNA polymerase-1